MRKSSHYFLAFATVAILPWATVSFGQSPTHSIELPTKDVPAAVIASCAKLCGQYAQRCTTARLSECIGGAICRSVCYKDSAPPDAPSQNVWENMLSDLRELQYHPTRRPALLQKVVGTGDSQPIAKLAAIELPDENAAAAAKTNCGNSCQQYGQANRGIAVGAQKAIDALREARLSLEALEEPSGDDAYRDELAQALRGGKDAAYRIAVMYRQGSHGLPKDSHRSEQWLHVAAELGNGNASWQVAQAYNRDGQMGEAAKFEAKAIVAGYRPPVRLKTRGMNY